MRPIAPKPHPSIHSKYQASLCDNHTPRVVKAPRKPGKESSSSSDAKALTNLLASVEDTASNVEDTASNVEAPAKTNKSDHSSPKFPKSSSKESTETVGEQTLIDLDNNPDYIALSSAYNLLASQKTIASQDILELKRLKAAALEDPKQFIQLLQAGKTGKMLPDRQKVVRAPIVPWSKYGIYNPGLDQRLASGIMDRSPSFGEFRLFGDSPGERRPSL